MPQIPDASDVARVLQMLDGDPSHVRRGLRANGVRGDHAADLVICGFLLRQALRAGACLVLATNDKPLTSTHLDELEPAVRAQLHRLVDRVALDEMENEWFNDDSS